jgi:integrase/recombinase XerD
VTWSESIDFTDIVKNNKPIKTMKIAICCTIVVPNSPTFTARNFFAMASVKVVLRKRANKDGTYPLALRITKDRKTSFVHLGYHLNPKDWEAKEQRVRKSHPNSTRLNNFIATKLATASNTSLEIESVRENATAQIIKHRIKPSAGASFFLQAQSYLDILKKTGSYASYMTEKSRCNKFRAFLNGKDIGFSEISAALLEEFVAHLKSERSVSERTAMNYLLVIRTIYNRAIEDGIADRKNYPFGKGRISIRFPSSTKVGSDEDDVRKLETVVLTNPRYDHVRNLWLFSYYFAGMRISDVLRLRWSDFRGGRLHYSMGKNNKPGSLKIPDKALAILKKYQSTKTSPHDLVFPELKGLPSLDNAFEVKRKISFAVTRLDKIMRERVAPAAGIKAKMSMHIARHTFATFAGDKIPVQMLQKLYRHSDIKTTIGYQANFINKDVDDALDSVINGALK